MKKALDSFKLEYEDIPFPKLVKGRYTRPIDDPQDVLFTYRIASKVKEGIKIAGRKLVKLLVREI